MSKQILKQRQVEAKAKWKCLDDEIKVLVIFREWVRLELESLRDSDDPEKLLNHSCTRHYQVITGVMFAYDINQTPEHIKQLPQNSLELLLNNFGINPREFL